MKTLILILFRNNIAIVYQMPVVSLKRSLNNRLHVDSLAKRPVYSEYLIKHRHLGPVSPQRLYDVLRRKYHMDRVKRIWCLSHMRAAKVQASLRIRAVSPEPPLLAHTSNESRGTFRQKARSLAPLNGWACAVKICHDGMLEDTNSLDGAHIVRISHYFALDLQKSYDENCLMKLVPRPVLLNYWGTQYRHKIYKAYSPFFFSFDRACS